MNGEEEPERERKRDRPEREPDRFQRWPEDAPPVSVEDQIAAATRYLERILFGYNPASDDDGADECGEKGKDR